MKIDTQPIFFILLTIATVDCFKQSDSIKTNNSYANMANAKNFLMSFRVFLNSFSRLNEFTKALHQAFTFHTNEAVVFPNKNVRSNEKFLPVFHNCLAPAPHQLLNLNN